MEKSRDVKRRHQRSKPFRFTPAQIARMDREEQRENRAKQIREKDTRRIANKKKKADAETKARAERRARGIPDPDIRVPSSQPLLSTFFNAQRDRPPQPVEASVFTADVDLPDGAILSTDQVVLGGTTDWDCFDLWTDGIDGCGPNPKPQRDPGKEEIVVVDSSCGGSGVDLILPDDHSEAQEQARAGGGGTGQEVAVEDMEETFWRSSPPVWHLDGPVSHIASSQELGGRLDMEGPHSVVQSAGQSSHGRQSPVLITQDLPRSSQYQQSPVGSAQRPPQLDQSPVASAQCISHSPPLDSSPWEESSRASSRGRSSYFASSQFDPVDFLAAEAAALIQPAIRSGDNVVHREGLGDDGGYHRRLSLASGDTFDDETAGWMEDIFVDTHGHPFSNDRVDT